MKVVENKIVEASESELWEKYLDEDWDDVMDFFRYMDAMEREGCTIVGERRVRHL